jgi:amino acid adenylation domain-containing protein
MTTTNTSSNILEVAPATTVRSAKNLLPSPIKPLGALFDEIAARHAGRTAVTFGDQQLSYRDLQIQAEHLARRLRSLGVGRDSLVGVFMERSPHAIVALLAVLKAGGAYLPLDPAYPLQRLAMILDDARPMVVLTEQHLLAALPPHEGCTLCVDRDDTAGSDKHDEEIEPNPDLQSLAYVIYTSGSTGKPKGVMVTHANVARLLGATAEWFHFNEDDVWTLFHSLAFDFSVWEIWGCLLHGGRLVVVPFDVSRSPQDFYELLAKERVTVLNQTPSAFYQLIAVNQAQQSPALSLRVIIFGGEALNFSMLKPWFAVHGDNRPRLINMYGITETTVHVTYREVTAADAEGAAHSLIGVPIPDLQLYLLGADRRPVPAGELGEIYVGGAGVARGYLNRPELNTERFIPDSFSGIPGARLYKSGDLARVLPDGELEYLGRGDAQVKIQGFRIELGEIETAIMTHSGIQEARVIAHTDAMGTKRLVAYFVPRERESVPVRELSEHLGAKLPYWMMPSVYLPIETFPLTPNGKVDFAALPTPASGSIASCAEPAGTEFEQQITAVWRSVLGAEHINLDDNFFDIGGTSLSLVSAHTQLEILFRQKIPITDLFAYTTVRALSARLGSSAPESASSNPVQDQAKKQRAAFARARAAKKAAL